MEVYPAGYASQWFLGLGESRPRMLSFSGSPLGLGTEPGRTLCEIGFGRGDRLFIFSEMDLPQPAEADPEGRGAAHLKETILSLGPGRVDEMAEGIWRSLKPASGRGLAHDAFLLGLELP